MTTRNLNPILLSIVSFLIVGLVSCTQSPGERVPADGIPGSESAREAAALSLQNFADLAWEDVPDPYSGGQIFAYLDSVPVTVEELERFNVRVLGSAGSMAHGGEGSMGIFKALPSFRRYFAVQREALRLGLEKEPLFIKRLNFTLRTALAAPFRDWLLRNAIIDPEELQRRIPGKWTQINFAMRVFATEEEAQKARSIILGEETFLGYGSSMSVAGKDTPETGLIFPMSGFFEAWDDGELFNLRQGETYGPVKTGLGFAIVLAKERKDFTEEERERYLSEIRSELSQRYAAEKWEAFRTLRQVEIFDEALEKAVFQEFSGGGFVDETVAAVDGDEISYRLFRLLNGKNYAHIKANMPRAYWKNPVRADVGSLVNQVIMGKLAQEAIANGRWTGEIPAGIVKALYDYRKTYLYYSFLDLVRGEVETELTDEEIRNYFSNNRGQFVQPAHAAVIYKFTIDKAAAEKWKKALASGGDFGEAANIAPGSAAPHQMGGGDGYSRVLVSQGDNQLKELQEKIFQMREGETRVLDSPMGYYLMKVEEARGVRQLTLEESRGEVKTRLINQRISERISQRVDALAAPVNVDVVGEVPPPEPRKDIPHPDLG